MNGFWVYIAENLLPIGVAVAGVVAWLFDKRKRKAEVDSITAINKQGEASALALMEESYQKFIKEVQRQLDEVRAENAQLKEQIKTFTAQAEKDARLISELKWKIESYERELKKFKRTNSI